MSYPTFIASGTCGDFQSFDRRLLARLKSLGQWRFQPPIAPPLHIVRGRDIGEGCVQRLGHPLSGAVRNIELSADVLKADTAPAGCRNLGKTKQILRFGERHLTSMPEIDTFVRY
jgi:hypothetical protein